MVAEEPERGWSPQEVRHAMWLRFGGRSPTYPDVKATAAAIGVSPRSVYRWLAGGSHPTPGHAAALRGVLSPPAERLRGQEMDRRHATAAVAELSRTRRRAASKQWRAMGWHEEHHATLLRHPTLGLRRVMVSTAHPAGKSPRVPPNGWEVVEQVTYPTRPAAVLAKHAVLDQVPGWRVEVHPRFLDQGRHECWLDTAPAVKLAATEAQE